jgi:hypothetical protein
MIHLVPVWKYGSPHNPAIFLLPTHIRSAGDEHGDRSNTAVATYCKSTQNSSDCTKGLMLRASVARVRLVVRNSASRNLNRPAPAELRLTSSRLERKMQVQNPVQAPLRLRLLLLR